MGAISTDASRRFQAVLTSAAMLPFAALLAASAVGCASTQPMTGGDSPRGGDPQYGVVYYLDGAGGGGTVSNWEGGLKVGLTQAGYKGPLSMFPWETGFGVLADQDAADNYKRRKASELAKEIVSFRAGHPSAPIHLVGLSAGTAVAVFTLEALPSNVKVEGVILLGASISNNYDLTQALSHVRNHLYVFTSERDAVLGFLVPMAGTADRTDAPSAGLDGFILPAGATPATRSLYLTKVMRIAWRTQFERDGDWGGHTDAVHPAFVRDYISPLIIRD